MSAFSPIATVERTCDEVRFVANMRRQFEMKKGRHAPSLREFEQVAVGDDVSRHLLTLGHVNLGLAQTRA